MGVVIRYRKTTRGYSPYLDIYQKGMRTYEHITLIVFKDYSKPIVDEQGKKLIDTKGKFIYPKPLGDDKIKIEILEKRRLQREIQLKSQEYDFLDPTSKNINLLDYLSGFGVSKYSSLKFQLEQCFGFHIPISIFNIFKVRKFIDHLRKCGINENTQNNYYSCLVATLNRAKRERIIVQNPCSFLAKHEKPKQQEGKRCFLTKDEVSIIASASAEEIFPQIREAFLFACMTGLRISDVRMIRITDIKDGVLQYRMQKVKSKVQYVPLSNQAQDLISKLKPDPRREYIFWELARNISQAYAGSVLTKWAKKLGIQKHVTWHVSRHTYATLLLNSGTDIYTVSKLLGHTNLKTTELYAKILDQKKVEAVNRLPVF